MFNLFNKNFLEKKIKSKRIKVNNHISRTHAHALSLSLSLPLTHSLTHSLYRRV